MRLAGGREIPAGKAWLTGPDRIQREKLLRVRDPAQHVAADRDGRA